jgi:hypothetical protein
MSTGTIALTRPQTRCRRLRVTGMDQSHSHLVLAPGGREPRGRAEGRANDPDKDDVEEGSHGGIEGDESRTADET